ncbi:MAG: sugar phosphate isomerase/epimerase [Phyllobacteriaceae bacterium]|nr:sugar phosphate isomerase/epimerase [Phyllobacteriaceae bacterium]
MPELRLHQSLWATELRRPGVPETPVEARFEQVAADGWDGMTIDLGAMDLAAARATVPFFARYGLEGGLTAFPRSIDELRPAIHLAKDIGAPFVVIVGQVMPVGLEGQVGVVREWLRIGREEGMALQFETHRASITNDLFSTLQLIDAVPEMRLACDLSHYVVDREMIPPLSEEMGLQISRILARCDSFQGRVASRNQIQVQLDFPQHAKWLRLFEGWWREGFARWRARAGESDRLVFLSELGPTEYAITDAAGAELSDRRLEALTLRDIARRLWAETAPSPAVPE